MKKFKFNEKCFVCEVALFINQIKNAYFQDVKLGDEYK